MANWFLGSIRFQKEDDSGSLVTHNKKYLVDAVSFTEAEARLFEIVTKSQPDFQLISLPKFKLSEVFFEENDSDTWYKAKVVYSSFDERSQKEKKTPFFMLINADNPKEAYEALNVKLGNLGDYHIQDIVMTGINEVCPYINEGKVLEA